MVFLAVLLIFSSKTSKFRHSVAKKRQLLLGHLLSHILNTPLCSGKTLLRVNHGNPLTSISPFSSWDASLLLSDWTIFACIRRLLSAIGYAVFWLSYRHTIGLIESGFYSLSRGWAINRECRYWTFLRLKEYKMAISYTVSQTRKPSWRCQTRAT